MEKFKDIIIRTYFVFKWGLFLLLALSFIAYTFKGETSIVEACLYLLGYIIVTWIFEATVIYIIEGEI
jgi:hypothetical protein